MIAALLSLTVAADAPAEVAPSQIAAAHSFGHCLVEQRRPAVEAFLRASNEREAKRISKRFSKELRCDSMMPGHDVVTAKAVVSSYEVFRGLLAEAMLESSGVDTSALTALPLRQQAYSRTWFAASKRNAVIDEMAACLADTAPQGIKSLLSTDPDSEGERAAFAKLNPDMTRCLSARAKLVGNRQSIRAALADALYQRLINPAASLPPAEANK